MAGLGQYITSIAAASLICGIVSSILPKGREKIRILCGCYLIATVLLPLHKIDISADFLSKEYASSIGFQSVAAGKRMARESEAAIIKEQLEAYILDKAADMNVELDIDISLNEDNIPEIAALRGNIGPYAKLKLQEVLEEELGITKENQVWTG